MKRLVLALSAAAIFLAAGEIAADAPHDTTNSMSCPTCHTNHPSPSAALTTPEGKTNLCKSCHNPVGSADSEVHTHAGSPDTICTTCHNPHTQEQAANGSTYGKYIRTTVQTPNSGPKTVIFKGATGPNSFADGDANYNGICEVCHTTTNYHRNNSSGDHTHHAGQNCMQCHSHTHGFQPQSQSCTSCHNQAQGAGGYRRQVVDGLSGPGDFSARSHHVYTGSTQSVKDSDCSMCHDTSAHQSFTDGISVKLKNPDGGASITYNGTGSTLENFCIACHDSNGYGGNMQPLSDGRTPVDIAFGTVWSTALHNTRGLTCYGNGSAGGCHANGHGSKKKYHLGPEGVAPNGTNYAEEEEGFCITCHGPSGPGRNIASQLTKLRDHGMDSSTMAGRHGIDEALIPSNFSGAKRHVECTDCHNQHWLQSGTTHTAGTNVASPVLQYVPRIQATYGTTAAVPPTFTPRTAKDTTPAKEYEICFKCHSSWAFGSTPPTTPEGTVETDVSVDFNPNNKSFHPVTGNISTNSYTIPTATNGNKQTMNAPWNTSSHKLMYCTDCHGSENPADPNGPHGSANNYMLINSDTEKGLCLVCHSASVYNPSSDPGTTETGSRFDQQTTGSNRANHYFHVTARGYTCRRCHGAVRTLTTAGAKAIETGSMHGTNTVPGLLNGRAIKGYSPGSCDPTCHGAVTYTAGAQ